uniref:JmjC domain-containing protein n=1 Tax=Tetranychus urticae TaxID=32264 RepID=T1KR59_TETUR
MGHKKVKGIVESKDVNQVNTIVVSDWSHLFDPKIADCSQCERIDQIVQVTNITRQQFEERFAYSMEPLVVRGIINDWKSLHDFSVDFFARLYSSSNPFYRCQFFPYKTPFKSLREALDIISGHVDADHFNSWYIGWSNCDPSITQKLRQYYKRPSFLPSDSEDSRLDWIFMGTPGYGAPMHIDNVGYPSWQAQIKGSKKWILEPPIECHFTCKRFEITVNSGDIIVLDTNKWFHETKIIGNDLSITIGSEYD